jgi:DNA-binding response OmpR family regulator
VWEWNFGDVSTVTVHVGRLREKIETDPGQPTRLLTVWGVGYRYEPAEQRPGMEAEHLHSRAG